MKRIVVIALALLTAAAALLVGAPAQAQQADHELNIGSLAPRGTPWYDTLETFKENVEEASGGRIRVILRPPGQMGEVEMAREVRRGERLQGAGITTAAIAEGGNISALQTVELPYLFRTDEEADHILDNVIWESMSTLLERRGFVLGIWSENGWRSFGTKGRALRTPADLRGFRMRSQESDVHMAMYNAYGAQAVQQPMTEVLTSLQSNVIDGLDNTPLYIMSAGLAGPLDYFTVTNHIYQPAAIIYSKRWFDTLPPDLQEIVMSQRDLAAEGRTAIRTESQAILELMGESLEVVELTDAEVEAFAEIGEKTHADFAAKVGSTALLTQIQEALAAFRSGEGSGEAAAE